MDKCLDPPGHELTSPRTVSIYQSLGKKAVFHKEVRVIWVQKEQVKGMRFLFGRHLGALEGGEPLLLPQLTSTRRAGAQAQRAPQRTGSSLEAEAAPYSFLCSWCQSTKCPVHSRCSISVW